jgi:hypothetical protein
MFDWLPIVVVSLSNDSQPDYGDIPTFAISSVTKIITPKPIF